MPRVMALADGGGARWLERLGFELVLAPEPSRMAAGCADLLCLPAGMLLQRPERTRALEAAAAARKAGIPVAVDLDLEPAPGVEREALQDLLRAVLTPAAAAIVRPPAHRLFPAFFTAEAIAEGLLDLGAAVAVVAPVGGKALVATRDRMTRKGPTPPLLATHPEARDALFAGFLLEWLPSRQAPRALERALSALPDRLSRGHP